MQTTDQQNGPMVYMQKIINGLMFLTYQSILTLLTSVGILSGSF